MLWGTGAEAAGWGQTLPANAQPSGLVVLSWKWDFDQLLLTFCLQTSVLAMLTEALQKPTSKKREFTILSKTADHIFLWHNTWHFCPAEMINSTTCSTKPPKTNPLLCESEPFSPILYNKEWYTFFLVLIWYCSLSSSMFHPPPPWKHKTSSLSSVHFALLKNVHALYQAHVEPLCTSRVGFYSEYISSNTKYTLMTAHSINSYLFFSNL